MACKLCCDYNLFPFFSVPAFCFSILNLHSFHVLNSYFSKICILLFTSSILIYRRFWLILSLNGILLICGNTCFASRYLTKGQQTRRCRKVKHKIATFKGKIIFNYFSNSFLLWPFHFIPFHCISAHSILLAFIYVAISPCSFLALFNIVLL